MLVTRFGWSRNEIVNHLSGLAQAIFAAIGDQDMRARAAKIGEHIRAEDGIGHAVEAFQHYCQLDI